MWIGAKVAGLFVLLGGLVGGLVTWATIFVASVVDAILNDSPITSVWLTQFITLAPAAVLVGILIGLLPAALTSWAYVSGPATWRRYGIVGLIGGGASALEGLYAATLMVPAANYPLRYLLVVATFAIAGAIATMACHHFAKRWPEFATSEA
jgi:hypothetical protein